MTVLTGAGDYYSSGNDLANLAVDFSDPKAVKEMAEGAYDVLLPFVDGFIEFPKFLLGAVNGPAFGIGFTSLAHCDVLFASDKASFNGPFVALGQCPEGCSSFLFPRIMGHSLAGEVLHLGRKLNAQEALECGFVSRVFPAADFRDEVEKWAKLMATSPPNALKSSKSLVRDPIKESLRKANRAECEMLVKLWQSQECFQAIMNFMKRKAK